MTQQRRLGKGLGALLGESALETERADRSGASDVEVSRISPNRYQPRKSFDDDAIDELAASIAAKGVLQPLIVTPGVEGDYMLVSGERRLRAARKAGLTRVPVIVRDLEDRELLEIALIENLQREDLDPIDEANGYHQLVSEFDMTQAEVAEEVGKSRPAVSNALRLLELPDAIQAMVRDGRLSAGHARALLGLADRRRMASLAGRIVEEGASVRQAESWVKSENGPRKKVRKAKSRGRDDLEREKLEEALQHRLGTRVRLRANAKGKGRIEIAFFSFDDLERIVAQLGVERG